VSYREDKTNFSPALVGSIGLHALVVAAILIGPWKPSKPVIIGESVPVTIVTEGPTNVRPAVEDVVDQTAQTEEPTPEATPQPPAPVPAPDPTPAPAPPKTAPTPVPTPKPPTPKPAPQAGQARARLLRLAGKDPGQDAQGTGKPVANAAKGPTRAGDRHPGPSRRRRDDRPAGRRDQRHEGRDPAPLEPQLRGRGRRRRAGQGQLQAGHRRPHRRPGDGRRRRALVRSGGQGRRRPGHPRGLPVGALRGLPPDYYGQQLNLNFKARDACAAR
jgi:protein TonB